MELAKIHHIAIIGSDYDASKDFYVNKLGFSVIRENYREERNDWKIDLKMGEQIELELFIEPNPIPIKEVMNYLNKEVGEYRLPLTNMSNLNKNILINELEEINK